MKTPPVVPGHNVTVTEVGPRWVTECSCGAYGEQGRRFASKRAANASGLFHLEQASRLRSGGRAS